MEGSRESSEETERERDIYVYIIYIYIERKIAKGRSSNLIALHHAGSLRGTICGAGSVCATAAAAYPIQQLRWSHCDMQSSSFVGIILSGGSWVGPFRFVAASAIRIVPSTWSYK